MTRESNEIQGIYIKDNKTFYYLETGNFKLINIVDRLKKRLLMKGVIKLTSESPRDKINYKICSLEEALADDRIIEVLYLNNHIKKVVNAVVEEAPKTPWK